MRVLVVEPGPHFSVADVCRGVAQGFRDNGCEVGVFNFGDRLDFYTQAALKKGRRWVRAFDYDSAAYVAAGGLTKPLYEWWPDVVVIVSGFFIPPQLWATLRMRPHHVVLWCTESPYEDDRQLRPAELADTVVINDPVNIEQYRAVNPNTVYVPHCYDPRVHRPGAPVAKYRADFGFVGTGFPSRVEFFEQVDWTGVDVKLAGNWLAVPPGSPLEPMLFAAKADCMDNAETVKLYRSVKVGANLYRREHTEASTADGVAMGPREVEMAASGLFYLRDPRPEGDELLPMLPTFEGPEEFGDLVRWWRDHDTERERAAAAAREAVADRTFTAQTARILRMVEPHSRRMVAG